MSAGFARKYQNEIVSPDMYGVKLFFDSERQAIGFQIAPLSEDGVLKIKQLQRGGYFVPARAFMVQYDIDDSYEPRYTPREEVMFGGKLFVIELKKKRRSVEQQ